MCESACSPRSATDYRVTIFQRRPEKATPGELSRIYDQTDCRNSEIYGKTLVTHPLETRSLAERGGNQVLLAANWSKTPCTGNVFLLSEKRGGICPNMTAETALYKVNCVASARAINRDTAASEWQAKRYGFWPATPLPLLPRQQAGPAERWLRRHKYISRI